MNLLLQTDFIAHYALVVRNINIPIQNTNAPYFELEDSNGQIQIYINSGAGTAAYRNPSSHTVAIINYEQFINSLPPAFQQGRKKCDLIIYTTNPSNYFLLNELTDTEPIYINDFVNNRGFQTGKRNKAIGQLVRSLNDLIVVRGINNFINQFQDKRCCFFNKKTNAPAGISATISFNRNNAILPGGIQSRNADIEARGFSFWEFWGGQVFALVLVNK